MAEFLSAVAWQLSAVQALLGLALAMIKTWGVSEDEYSRESDLLRSSIYGRISDDRIKMISGYVESQRQARLGATEEKAGLVTESGRRVAWEIEALRRLFDIERDVESVDKWHHLFLGIGLLSLLGLVLSIGIPETRVYVAGSIVITLATTLLGAVSVRRKKARLVATKRHIYRSGNG